MHVLAVNSVSTLLNYLTEHLQKTPTLHELQKWIKDDGDVDVDENNSDDDHASRSLAVDKAEVDRKESYLTAKSSSDDLGKVIVEW